VEEEEDEIEVEIGAAFGSSKGRVSGDLGPGAAIAILLHDMVEAGNKVYPYR
jgi:hypothetical protein